MSTGQKTSPGLNNTRDLRIVFMGTPDFAVDSLDILVKNGYNVVGVITAPDKPSGRGRKIRFSAVKEYAISTRLNILQPSNLKDKGFIKELRELQANLQVIVAFRMLPRIVWTMPGYGAFNLHASLLPDYRGAAPINWAIINGETETGVTTFFLDDKIDTGKIIFREKTRIKQECTFGDLHDELKKLGAGLVLKTVRAIENDNVTTVKQEDLVQPGSKLHAAPKIYKDDCRIDWEKDVKSVYNFIRGLDPVPASFTYLVTKDGQHHLIRLFDCGFQIDQHTLKPGNIDTDGKNYLRIAALNGWIEIFELQLSGKRKMKTAEFLRGFHVSNENFFS